MIRWWRVRHSTRAVQVADPDNRFACRGRSRAGGHLVHRGSPVATTTQRQAAVGGWARRTLKTHSISVGKCQIRRGRLVH